MLDSLSMCAVTLQRRNARGDSLEIVAEKQVSSLGEARKLERELKGKKNPRLAIYHLQK